VRLLAGQLALHDVADTEVFCAAIVHTSKLQLSPLEREELLTFLIEEAWRLSGRYEPGGMRFSAFASYMLKWRIVDWQRKRFGRTKWAHANGKSSNGRFPSSSASTIPSSINWDSLSPAAA
jgi:hypothetical protein